MKTTTKKTTPQLLEIVGLFLLLFAFGWQCIQENREAALYRSMAYDFNQQLYTIHSLVYNDAIKQDYYKGSKSFKMDEGAASPRHYDWENLVNSNGSLKKEVSCAFIIRAIVYILGSSLVIVGKWKLMRDSG